MWTSPLRGVEHPRRTNDHDSTVWSGNQGALDDAFLAPLWYFPSSNTDQAYGIPWANWYTGQPGPKEQPPVPTRRQMELYDRLTESPDGDERRSLLKEILSIAKEEFYVIGTGLPTSDYGIVNRNLRNVVEPMPQLWVYPTPAPSRPERYFFAPPEQ